MEYRENWCSDTSSRGSLKAGSILPWKSFEHLSLKQARNQKQRLMRLMHRAVPHLKVSQMLRSSQQILVEFGVCLMWHRAPYGFIKLEGTCWLLDHDKHNRSAALLIGMDLAVKWHFVVCRECVSVVLFPAQCCLTLCYPPQSNKHVAVLVKCSQLLIIEEQRFKATNSVAIGDSKK